MSAGGGSSRVAVAVRVRSAVAAVQCAGCSAPEPERPSCRAGAPLSAGQAAGGPQLQVAAPPLGTPDRPPRSARLTGSSETRHPRPVPTTAGRPLLLTTTALGEPAALLSGG